MDISFVIVNYQSREHLKKCIESLKDNASGFAWEVIIINNDQEELNFSPALEDVKIINHGINDGFSKACNLGAKNSTGEVLFFLNPDTQLLTSNIHAIKTFFSLNTDAGIVAPRLVTTNGAVQRWSTGFEVTLWDIVKNNVGLIASKSLWDASTKTQTDWVSGAALAIKKSVFENINGFDENFFMYFEDVDLCKRVTEMGKKIFILPNIKILHIGGQSTSNTKKQKLDYYTSQDYYFKKHFGKVQLFLLKILRYFSLFIKK